MLSNLPMDGMGAILNQSNVSLLISQSLRLASELSVIAADARLAISVGLTNAMLVSEAPLTGVSRHSASMAGFMRSTPARIEPDETVSAVALRRGAGEVAQVLAEGLINAFRRR